MDTTRPIHNTVPTTSSYEAYSISRVSVSKMLMHGCVYVSVSLLLGATPLGICIRILGITLPILASALKVLPTNSICSKGISYGLHTVSLVVDAVISIGLQIFLEIRLNIPKPIQQIDVSCISFLAKLPLLRQDCFRNALFELRPILQSDAHVLQQQAIACVLQLTSRPNISSTVLRNCFHCLECVVNSNQSSIQQKQQAISSILELASKPNIPSPALDNCCKSLHCIAKISHSTIEQKRQAISHILRVANQPSVFSKEFCLLKGICLQTLQNVVALEDSTLEQKQQACESILQLLEVHLSRILQVAEIESLFFSSTQSLNNVSYNRHLLYILQSKESSLYQKCRALVALMKFSKQYCTPETTLQSYMQTLKNTLQSDSNISQNKYTEVISTLEDILKAKSYPSHLLQNKLKKLLEQPTYTTTIHHEVIEELD